MGGRCHDTQAAKLPEQRQDHAQRTVRSVSLSSNSRRPQISQLLSVGSRGNGFEAGSSDENSFITNSSEELRCAWVKRQGRRFKGSTFQDSTP